MRVVGECIECCVKKSKFTKAILKNKVISYISDVLAKSVFQAIRK